VPTDLSVTPEVSDRETPCRTHPRGHSDAAKRCADNVNVHYAANELGVWDAVGKWLAVRLSDGGTDQTAYDSKAEAVRHQPDEFLCVYIRLIGMRMDVCEAESFMETNRRLYDKGWRLADPDARSGGRQHLQSNRTEIRQQVLEILRSVKG
jgi:hypothetical protein